MCNQFTFHHQFRIDRGRSKFEQTTNSTFLLVDPTDKEDKDPEKIDLGAPRLTWYKQKVWKKHQNTVYWVDINFAQRKGLKFCQTLSNVVILYNTLPAYCIPKVVRMETGEIINEKVYERPRMLPKISLRHDWRKELGSEVARQAEVNQQPQPNPNPNHEKTGRPVVTEQTSRSSAQGESIHVSLVTARIPERLDKDKDTQKRRCRS